MAVAIAHEKENIVAALADLCMKQRIKTLIQVGAGDGFEAYVMQMRSNCRAIAIEGNRNMASINPNLEFHHGIIGSMDCGAMFYVHQNPGLSGLIPRADGHETPFTTLQQRLDTWCRLHGGIQPDALIIDTEGTTFGVLEGCGDLLDGVNVVYAECQTAILRPGMSLLKEVDSLLVARGMTRHEGLPSYDEGTQGNYTWVR